jgi:hypothetical protein
MLRKILKMVLPKPIARKLAYIRGELKTSQIFKNKNLKETFSLIYKNNMWGNKSNESEIFYSGPGSHDISVIIPYIQSVSSFLNSHNPKLKVLDLGCGDFNVGKNFLNDVDQYIAADIVEDMIKFHNTHYANICSHLKFICLDLVNDHWPDADCVFIREVLQHLKNDDIKKVIKQFKKFKYIIVTECLPLHDFVPNKDKKNYVATRVANGSGINLEVSPFNLSGFKSSILCEVIRPCSKVRTILYENIENF